MKSIGIADQSALKNELRKYKHGRKLEIAQFNQAARLAWLGQLALSPLDPEDPECHAWLLHLQPPAGLAAEILHVDQALLDRIHVLDGEQGRRLAEILREGLESRARELAELDERDFYLANFYHPDKGA